MFSVFVNILCYASHCVICIDRWYVYTLWNKNPSARNFPSPEPEVTYCTLAIIIRVILLYPYLRIRGVSPSSIHYNQSHRVYINQRHLLNLKLKH